jgi:hypothetical protein
MALLKFGDGKLHEVKVGEWVEFKSDIEQSAKVIAINGDYLVLEAPADGFEGAYLRNARQTTERASDCWKD